MPYTATDGLPQEHVARAEEITAYIISHMQNQVAEQTGAGVHHPYAFGKFDIEQFKDGPTFVAQLTFYPSSMGNGGEIAKPKVVEKGKSRSGVVYALQELRHYVDPTMLQYRNKIGALGCVGVFIVDG